VRVHPIVFILALAACGQPRASAPGAAAKASMSSSEPVAAAARDAASISPAAPTAQDYALASQIAKVPVDISAPNGETDTGTVSQGDYLGQPLEERKAQQSLPQAHDGLWRTLATTKIGEDGAHGIFTARHSPQVRALVGQTLTLSGFIMPLETTDRFRHFLLTRYTPVCPFCPPGAPNEVVEVWSAQPIAETYDLMRATGRFSLADNGEKGLFFRLDGANIEKAAGRPS
jgi:hypothetical protein